jgi:hypothetical protein
MKHYTANYKVQSHLEGYPKVLLSCGEERNRWICSQHREPVARIGFEYLLVDNYGASFSVRLIKEENGEITLNNKSGITRYDGVNSVLVFQKLPMMRYPLPNFAIDVLQTLTVPAGIETLRRVAESFAKTLVESRDGQWLRTIPADDS